MFLNFTNMSTSLNIYYMCVVSLPLRWLLRSSSKQGNLNWFLIPGSGLGAMGNKNAWFAHSKCFLMFFLNMHAFMFQTTAEFLA